MKKAGSQHVGKDGLTHYQRNKEHYKLRNTKRRLRNTKYINDIKEKTPCTDCGKNYPGYVMDFDHCRGKKLKDVSLMRDHGHSLIRI